MISKKMRLFLPQIIWTGASISFWSGMLAPMLTFQLKKQDKDMEEDLRLSKVLDALIFFGIGATSGGALMASVIDKLTLKRTIIVNTVLLYITISCTAWTVFTARFDWISFVTCFLWGFTDTGMAVHTHSVCGGEFSSATLSFAVLNIV